MYENRNQRSRPRSRYQLIKNDRCRNPFLSKIAHMQGFCEAGSPSPSRSVSLGLSSPRCTDFRDIESINDVSIRQSKFVSTIEADLVRPLFDGEHATHMAVMTAKRELDDPMERVHRSWSRLRSQVPLASSQLSKVVTLALAKAIEQSAAP
jgi:hypothetical protein